MSLKCYTRKVKVFNIKKNFIFFNDCFDKKKSKFIDINFLL